MEPERDEVQWTEWDRSGLRSLQRLRIALPHRHVKVTSKCLYDAGKNQTQHHQGADFRSLPVDWGSKGRGFKSRQPDLRHARSAMASRCL
jgi:hypothetical protein